MKRITIGKLVIYENHKNLHLLLPLAEKIVNDPGLVTDDYRHEHDIRVALQHAMEKVNCPVSMTYNGNGVWPFTKTVRDFKKVVKANDTFKMTKHLYQFFNLQIGTIAHFNKNGWASVYPDNRALWNLFQRNEYGYNVLDYVQNYKPDVKKIVTEMYRILKGVRS